MDLASPILDALTAQSLPLPSRTWTANLVSSRTPPPPLPSLVATARARLLAADLTSSGLLDPAYVRSHSLPTAVTEAEIRDMRLQHDVVVQILDMENISRSRWEQVEELEAIERGEQTRGRQMIRIPAGHEDGDVHDGDALPTAPVLGGLVAGADVASKNATHKLVLQDAKGQKVYGIELRRIDGGSTSELNIGGKLLLRRGLVVARAMVLLEPSTCKVLGGKVDAWRKPWDDGRMTRLRELT